MSIDEDIKLLEDNGWIVECQSPFEISNAKLESLATGYAAELVLKSLQDENAWENKVVEELAQEFVDGNNETNDEKSTVDTLFNFGSMGVRTPREIITVFFNSFKKKGLI
jgi:hypothetical protein